jgi:5'-nucleotidase
MHGRRLVVVALVAIALLMGGQGAQGASIGRAERRAAAAPPQRPLRILVTNDDGVGAAGIDVLVETLRRIPNVVVTVIAPATNQSGTGDRFSTTALTPTAAATAHGYPSTAVNGFPADTVFLGVKQLLKLEPDVVVSGINQGQNIGELSEISGTVGAARTAARLGIPAIAVSQGVNAPINYDYAAVLTSFLVQVWRNELLARPRLPVKVFNVNVPTCATVRGVKQVPIGDSNRVVSYNESSPGSFQAVTEQRSLTTVDCTSTQQDIKDDIDAFNHGFASISLA